MGEHSKIEWTKHTFNPWWGCARVSPACDHCYAATLAKRFEVGWGKASPVRTFGDKHWNEPLRWDRAAEKAGTPARVFCASMADVFERREGEIGEVMDAQRARLWPLIESTPNLRWLLLTKRPKNVLEMVPSAWRSGLPSNIWMGTTVEDQLRADERIPHLLRIPAAVRFLSCEPLLGAVDLVDSIPSEFGGEWRPLLRLDALRGGHRCGSAVYNGDFNEDESGNLPRIHWVIAGGESGPGARPTHPDWFRSLRNQCTAAGVPFFFKQWGDWKPICQMSEAEHNGLYQSNRVAEEGEDQGTLDEFYGRRCTVPTLVLRKDGDHAPNTAPNAYEAGRRPVLAFRVGKHRAGRRLGGLTWDEVPS